jgi:nucleoside-diphosphate-sugar epimerase
VSKTHLVTGATGFVGGALVLELLRQTDDPVVCLVRAPGPERARERLHESLAEAAVGYGRDELLGEIARRCRAVPGDILRPGCGAAGVRADEVWHCAASLKYEDEQAAEIFQHNVEGTRNVLDLARAAGVTVFNHVSTAYVAGRRTGVVREELVGDEEVCNNRYEQSKVRGERLVAGVSDMHVRILRPSIVIGHSRTLVATSFTGLYGFIRGLGQFRRAVARRLGDFLTHRAVRVLADPATRTNFIPVDAVAANAVAIGRSNTSAGVFHLTNACMPTVGQGMMLLFRELGLRAPRFIGSAREFTSIDEALDREVRFYSSYMLNGKDFDRGNTDAVAGTASHYPMTDDVLLAHVRWFVRTQTREGRARAKESVAVAS